jgi:hypothetical protein
MHPAKFYNEQEVENIKEAIGRYEISHPDRLQRHGDLAVVQSEWLADAYGYRFQS